MIKQLFGTMYTVFCAKCLPRLWDEQFQDEAHVRREMEAEAHGGLVGWNFPATERNIERDSRLRNCQLGTYLTGEEEPTMKKLPPPQDPDAREKIYMILSVAIMFPWLLWLIIELPYPAPAGPRYRPYSQA